MGGFLKNLGFGGKSDAAKLEGLAAQKGLVLQALSKVIDPDLNKDIVSLGFVKDIAIDGARVALRIELTTPACPVKDAMKLEIETLVGKIAGVEDVKVEFSAETRRSRSKASQETLLALGQVRNLVAVASGKGGVGKSTSTVNLAFALARMGSKVGILDADVHGPSMVLMSGVSMPTETKDQMVVPPQIHGVKVISASMFSAPGKANIMRGPMTAQVIKQFLTQIYWGELDYLLIDYPPGTGDIQLSLSQIAPLTGAVIVTTPQEVALIDARKAVEMFNVTKVPILGVIETMSFFVCDGCDKKHFLFREGGGKRLAGGLGVRLLGEVPMDASMTTSTDSGQPIVLAHPENPTARVYIEAAGALAAQLSILNMADQGGHDLSLTWN